MHKPRPGEALGMFSSQPLLLIFSPSNELERDRLTRQKIRVERSDKDSSNVNACILIMLSAHHDRLRWDNHASGFLVTITNSKHQLHNPPHLVNMNYAVPRGLEPNTAMIGLNGIPLLTSAIADTQIYFCSGILDVQSHKKYVRMATTDRRSSFMLSIQ